MRVINVSLNELETKLLMIGFQGENEITQVRIDAAEILTDYPTATPTLIVKPLFGFAYPVIVAMEGTDVVWNIDNSVLSIHGDGEIQLTFTQGTVIAKSYVGRIRIKRSLAVNGEAPDPIETWEQAATAKLAEVDAQIGELEDMVEAAEAAKDQAQNIVDDAAADIQAAGAAQVQVVQAAGEEVLDSIPSDYSTLSGEVTDLKSAISDSINRIVTISSNLINPDDRTVGYVKVWNGDVAEDADYSTSGYLRIESGQYVRKVDKSGLGADENSIAVYKNDKTFLARVDGTVLSEEWTLFNIPSGARYTRITTLGTSLMGTYFGKGTESLSTIPKYGFYINQDGTIDYSQINNAPELNFIRSEIDYGVNLYDPSEYVEGEYIGIEGTIYTAANTGRSKVINLPKGNYLIRAWKDTYGNNARIMRLYTSNEYTGPLYGTIISDSGNDSIMAITIEDDNQGIMFNVRFPRVTMIVRGTEISDYPSEYTPYSPDVVKIEPNIMFNQDMIDYLSMHTDVNPLYQKFLAVDGDSICWGNGYRGGYAKIITDNNGMGYENLAVGGGTIVAETYSSEIARHWICRSMQNLTPDADYYLIEGGVNDSSLQVTLGSITSGWNDALDDTTFYGALETIFKTLTTKYVGKKYGFVIPHRMEWGMYPTGNYYKAIIECASKWGVKVLDLTQSVPPFNQFRNTDDYNTIRNAYTTSGDGWHPTELCYRKYYVPQIEAFLKTL